MIYLDDTPELGKVNYPYPKNKAIGLQNLGTSRGLLIEVEGLDGSGKSSQCKKLLERLQQDYKVFYINFIHSDYIKVPLLKTKWENCDPYTFSLMYSMGLQHAYSMEILPKLKKNKIVVLDRYLVTVYMKAVLSGLSLDWIKVVTSAVRPADIKLFIDTKPEVCMKRKLNKSGILTYWECGGSSIDTDELRNRYQEDVFKDRFLKYQTGARDFLIKVCDKENWKVFDGNGSLKKLNDEMYFYILKEIDKVGYVDKTKK